MSWGPYRICHYNVESFCKSSCQAFFQGERFVKKCLFLRSVSNKTRTHNGNILCRDSAFCVSDIWSAKCRSIFCDSWVGQQMRLQTSDAKWSGRGLGIKYVGGIDIPHPFQCAMFWNMESGGFTRLWLCMKEEMEQRCLHILYKAYSVRFGLFSVRKLFWQSC